MNSILQQRSENENSANIDWARHLKSIGTSREEALKHFPKEKPEYREKIVAIAYGPAKPQPSRPATAKQEEPARQTEQETAKQTVATSEIPVQPNGEAQKVEEPKAREIQTSQRRNTQCGVVGNESRFKYRCCLR